MMGVTMNHNAFLDVTIMSCPNCGKYYADASWYVLDMSSDTECGVCGHIFNTLDNAVDRVLVEFRISGSKVVETLIRRRLSMDK
jgi:hypothetical protein